MKTNKFYLLIAAVLTLLFTLPPTHTLAQENIVDRLDTSLGVKLPAEYDAKVREFVMNNKILKDVGTADYTAQFIEKQMKVDWKIDKQNQLVFLWHCIYKQITHEDLFNPEDGDSNRLQDFNDRVVGARIRAEGQRYKNEIIAYMNQRKAEADRQIAEADRQIAEADRQIAEAKQRSAEARQETLNILSEELDVIISSYNNYKSNDKMLEKLKSAQPTNPVGACKSLTQKHVAKRYMIAEKLLPLHHESYQQYKYV